MDDSNDFDFDTNSNPSDAINCYIISKFNNLYERIGHSHPNCSANNCLLFTIFYFTEWKKYTQRRNASRE